MADKKPNKIVYDNTVLIDLTADTVAPDKMLAGFTAHDQTGNIVTGTCTFDADTGDATVQVAEVLSGQTFYARGAKMTGTMKNNGGVSLAIDDVNDRITIAQGYHDGSGKAAIADAEKAKLIASNIKQGITILGVLGSLEPSSAVTVQAKSCTPKTTQQVVVPDSNIDYLSQVTVAAIPYVETANSAGGLTVTIAG